MPSDKELDLLDAYWRAANYLTVGQIYLLDNPLLQEPLKAEHIKPRLLGHSGHLPGQTLLYVHLNRLIRQHEPTSSICPAPATAAAVVANVYLEGTYSEIYPEVSQDVAGMRKLFRQFSTPGGIPSHVSVTTPGSIHEGGELGYVLVHAFGAAFDNLDLIVAAVVGDGEAETDRSPAAGRASTSEPGARRRRAADPPPERLQDLRPDRARPLQRRRRARAAHRSRLRCGIRRGRRAGQGAPPARRDARRVLREDPGDPGGGPPAWGHRAPPLASDRAAHAEGLDRAQGRRWRADRGHVPRAPGAAERGAAEARPSAHARRVDAQLRPRSLRRRRPPGAGGGGAGPGGRAAHGRQSARTAAARPLRSRCRTSGRTP